jgi:hypothetical protein
VCALVSIIAGCQKSKVDQNTPGKETNSVTKLKVNATQEDLCRLVLKQEVFQDTAISNDTKSVIMTMLSDGSEIRNVVEVDSLTARHVDYTAAHDFHLSKDMSSVVFTIGYAALNRNINSNVFIYCIDSHKKDSLFKENIEYKKSVFGLFVNHTIYEPKKDLITISTNVFFRQFNIKTHTVIDLPVFGRSILPFGDNKIIYNKVHDDSVYCAIYDVNMKTSIMVNPIDTLDLQKASSSENYNRILLQKEIYNDSIGKIGDSLLFYDKTFTLKYKSFIQNKENYRYTVGLSGNWIYFVDTVSVRRIRTEELMNQQCTNYSDLVTKSQLIYELPYVIRDTDVKIVCQGAIVQILPIKSEDK